MSLSTKAAGTQEEKLANMDFGAQEAQQATGADSQTTVEGQPQGGQEPLQRPAGDPATAPMRAGGAPSPDGDSGDDAAEAPPEGETTPNQEGEAPQDPGVEYWMSKAHKAEQEVESAKQKAQQLDQILQDPGAYRALVNYYNGSEQPATPGDPTAQQHGGQSGQSGPQTPGVELPENLELELGEQGAKAVRQMAQLLNQSQQQVRQLQQQVGQVNQYTQQQIREQQTRQQLRNLGLTDEEIPAFRQDLNDPEMTRFIQANGIRGWKQARSSAPPAPGQNGQSQPTQRVPDQRLNQQPPNAPPPAAPAAGQQPAKQEQEIPIWASPNGSPGLRAAS